MGVAVDHLGSLYIADSGNGRIRKVSGGNFTTVAGGGRESGENIAPTRVSLNNPLQVAVDGAGDFYILESDRIRKVSGGNIKTIAGGGTESLLAIDNVSATCTQLKAPAAVAVDPSGTIYVADTGNLRIRKIADGIITTVVGGGAETGDNIPAAGTKLGSPQGVAVDEEGSLYYSDAAGGARIRKVSNGIVGTIAGGGNVTGTNAPATSAQLSAPVAVFADRSGVIYIVERDSNLLRVLIPTPADASSTGPALTAGNESR